MLPVTHGVEYTKLQALLYTLILFAASLLPFATGLSGSLYLLGALVLGVGYLYWAFKLMWGKDPKIPMASFKYSIIYLMALFMIMLLDHYMLPAATIYEVEL